MRNKTYKLVLCAIFTAIICVFSQIVIPLGAVPLNLATFAIILCGGVLGIKYGTTATLLYVFIGVIGIPVFAGFKGGAGVLIGPTGGFIIGYLFMALLSGIAFRKKRSILITVLILCAANTMCYIFGTYWYMLITKTGLLSAISACVLPFIPGDAVKVAIAYPVIVKIKKQI